MDNNEDRLSELIKNATETDLFSDLSKSYKIYAMTKGKIIATFYNLKYRFYNSREMKKNEAYRRR